LTIPTAEQQAPLDELSDVGNLKRQLSDLEMLVQPAANEQAVSVERIVRGATFAELCRLNDLADRALAR